MADSKLMCENCGGKTEGFGAVDRHCMNGCMSTFINGEHSGGSCNADCKRISEKVKPEKK